MENNSVWQPNLVDNDIPLYIQLADKMAEAIASGELAVGEKLPPQRQLAWRLNINLSTVTKAFHLASQRHLISGEVGRGTFVLAQSSEAQLYQLHASSHDELINLSTHIPAKHPEDHDLKYTLQKLINDDHSLETFNHYLSPQTLKRIQICAKKWLAEFNYIIDADDCLATNTAQNALLVTLLASCQRDDVVLVDELTFPGMKTVAKQLRLKLHGIKMDEQGITPQALVMAIRTTGSTVLVSDPTLQNPTASCMSEQRKLEIIAIVKQYNLLFIEEYVVGALSGQAPISSNIQQHSILITSFAKAVSPGIRFAVIAGQHPLMSTLKQESHATTWQLSPLIADIACQWIENGTAHTRLIWQQKEMLERFRLFKKIFPSTRYAGNLHTSAHVWLATIKNSEQVQTVLHHLGVEVVPSKYFAVNHLFPHFIRVSLSAAKSKQQLKIALETIANANVIKTISR